MLWFLPTHPQNHNRIHLASHLRIDTLANTLRILEAANFEPRQAVALAEAIDGEVHASQSVTVPVLDARMMAIDARFAQVDSRFSEVKLQIAQSEARLVNRMIGFGFAAVSLIVTTVFFIVQHFR